MFLTLGGSLAILLSAYPYRKLRRYYGQQKLTGILNQCPYKESLL